MRLATVTAIVLLLASPNLAAGNCQEKVGTSKANPSARLRRATDSVTSLRRSAAEALTSGDREKALAHLLRAKAIAPANPDVLFEFGMVALGMSLYQDAKPALIAALAKRPAEPKFIYALARARLDVGEVSAAELLFKRYVNLRPDDASGHYGLGLVLMRLRRAPEAKLSFQQSLRLRPEQTEAQYQLGLIAYAEGDMNEAADNFKRVLARSAGHSGALLGIGQTQFTSKQYETARENLERVITLDPSLQKAHYYLSMTYARLGNKEAAAREAEIAATLEREQKNQNRIVLRLLDAKEAKKISATENTSGDVPTAAAATTNAQKP